MSYKQRTRIFLSAWSLLLLGLALTLSACGERIPSEAERNARGSHAGRDAADYSLIDINDRNYIPGVFPENMTVAEKKERFFYLVAPVVEKVHGDLMGEFLRAAKAIDTGQNQELELLRAHHRVDTDKELLQVLKPHPKSIALAQAAMESAWGTSRFFCEANNIYGVWSFNKNEPRIAAGEQRGAQTIWVKKYDSLHASIRDYFRVMARGYAYEEFQQLKMETDDPYQLVQKLDHYSEKGAAYGQELSAMIRYNNFQKYD